MKSKKHIFHPKSYPVPSQLAAMSRNQYGSNMIKGGTLQVPIKSYITRAAKSPPSISKKTFDIPTNTNPKLMVINKQQLLAKLQPTTKEIKLDQAKVLKKSLSNNDIQITNQTMELHKQPSPMPLAFKSQTVSKRHSPSPTQQLKSPSPPRSSAGKVPVKAPNRVQGTKPKVADFQAKNTTIAAVGSGQAPWAEFL